MEGEVLGVIAECQGAWESALDHDGLAGWFRVKGVGSSGPPRQRSVCHPHKSLHRPLRATCVELIFAGVPEMLALVPLSGRLRPPAGHAGCSGCPPPNHGRPVWNPPILTASEATPSPCADACRLTPGAPLLLAAFVGAPGRAHDECTLLQRNVAAGASVQATKARRRSLQAVSIAPAYRCGPQSTKQTRQ